MWSSWGGCKEIPEIDAEIEWDAIEGKSLPLDADGGVKVLSEKMGSGDNFYNDRMGPESIRINVRNLSDKL